MTPMFDTPARSAIDWVDLTRVPTLHGTTDRVVRSGPAAGAAGRLGRLGRLGMCGLARAVTLEPGDGIDVLVTLVETAATFEEIEPRTRVVRYPIVDMGVPSDVPLFADVVDGIAADVRAGRTVVVSCQAGYGRTGMTVACVLITAGLGAEDAVDLVRAARLGTIETDEQLAFVQAWAARD